MGCKKIIKYGCLTVLLIFVAFCVIMFIGLHSTTADDYIIDSVSFQRVILEDEDVDSCKVYKINFHIHPHSYSTAFLKDIRPYLNGCADPIVGYSVETSSGKRVDSLFGMLDPAVYSKYDMYNDSESYEVGETAMTLDSIMDNANQEWRLTDFSYLVKLPDTTEIPNRIILKFSGHEVICKIKNEPVHYKVEKEYYVNPNGITKESLRY